MLQILDELWDNQKPRDSQGSLDYNGFKKCFQEFIQMMESDGDNGGKGGSELRLDSFYVQIFKKLDDKQTGLI